MLDLRYGKKLIGKEEYKKLMKAQGKLISKLVPKAEVVLATSVTAGGYQVKELEEIPVVIMDESTQSTEACSLIPLSAYEAQKFVFVGDEKQLSSFSEIPYLEQSLFERILKNGTYKNPHMLNVQYRMHPMISQFPIKRFYKGLLTDGVTEEERTFENTKPLTFIDYGKVHQESKVMNSSKSDVNRGYTFQNKGEAQMILRTLKDLVIMKDVSRRNIGIVTPYSAQRNLVAEMVQRDHLINPKNERIQEEIDDDFSISSNKRPASIKTICGIMVSSIDAFQGREKDFIIFSCVRSNPQNNIGFVKDARRLNVALTRAKYGLILVGNKSCMQNGDTLWKDLIHHFESKNCVATPNSLGF
ncbi:Regulator of nonsense transcripts 1 [Wickerhamomyces ciferrii]|uniref:Regulator of nonsense transcripts 1 n=1 Tax=Wickerhamomyces ciferrii (strain ATCC 14091 / BCRC 22168 / CBS 111 / JCM 3599 / NBRC 0793 / NRRL Y-1031 F-60-10) TaxID=1206466 RepID=K0KB31_WICCF|nr:Regulator of nonsense transcripts 1 [Wickerhamomyces ciferrii]CCH42205.1 Regulator of nonsense transcripts 1 [Wickerhamomyces ciferrii]